MITYKTKEEIKKMREGGKILAGIIKYLSNIIKPGLNASELDLLAGKLAAENNATPAFKGYSGYPANLCVSVNNEVVHGLPFDKILKDGDIVGLDFGLKYKGLFTDHAVTVGVGNISDKAKKLIHITRRALYLGIKSIYPGRRIGAISEKIQNYVESKGYSVVRDLTGHGVGYKVHESPQVPNFGKKDQGPEMKEGMVLAIEPMVNIGDYQVKLNKDGWTFVTQDNALSAHFEHTVVVTKNGFEILTK